MTTSNSTPNGVDRIESADNIALHVSKGANRQTGEDAKTQEVPISRLDTTKEITIKQSRESSVKANGFSVTAIKYSGTMMFKGSTLTRHFENGSRGLYNLLYDENGISVPVSITIVHDLADEPETYQTVLVTSEDYKVRTGEMTEHAFDWVAMDRSTDQPN